MSEELLTRPQLAIELGLSERALIRLEKKGEGPPRTMIGRRITYRKETIRQWLKDREQAQAAKPSANGRSRPKAKR